MKRLSFIFLAMLLLTSCGKGNTAEDQRKPFNIQTVLSSALSRNILVEKTAVVKAGTQVVLTAQSNGRVGTILAQPGQAVVAGQVLVALEDMYGTADNSISEANIALENARLTFTATSASLAQSLSNAKITYEKAQKDYESAQVNAEETLKQAERTAASLASDPTKDPTSPLSKAELDLANFIASQQKQLDAFETSYDNQLKNFQTFLANVVDTSDILLGVSEQNIRGNDTYEYLLSAKDPQQKTRAEDNLRQLLKYQNWSPDAKLPLLERVTELQKVHNLVNTLLNSVETVLIQTIPDASVFSPTTLASYRTTIDAYQAQYSGISTALVTFLNTSQTFLATYQNERLAREQAVKLAADNGASALEQTKIAVANSLRAAESGMQLAKNAYETTQKTHDISLQQLSQSVDAAAIRLRNAQSLQERLLVTAPVNGIVGAIRVDVGEEVTNGRQILEIASKDAETNITVDSTMLQHIHVGMPVSIMYRGWSLAWSIASISPIANQGLNFAVTVAINDAVTVFGDFATIQIPMMSQFPALPITAITLLAPGQGEISVLESNESGDLTIKKISVVLWTLWGDRVEILSDIPDNTEIILSDLKNYNPMDFVLRKKNLE